MGFTPYTYSLGPAEGDAEQQARIEDATRRARENWRDGHDARKAAVETGPKLKDIEAAADCVCACHPRPASLDLHGGGVTCPCQLTEQEHKKLMDDLLGAINKPFDDKQNSETRAEFLRELSSEFNADIWEAGGAAPYVVRGVVDGRFFYLRERHDVWRVEVAPDDDPLRDIWVETLPAEVDRVVVAEGSSATLYDDDPKTPTRIAVEAVRTFLLRRSCGHAGAQIFCPLCGVKIHEGNMWVAPRKRDAR